MALIFGTKPFVRITICSKFVLEFVLLAKYGGATGKLLRCANKSPLPVRLYNSNSTAALVWVMSNEKKFVNPTPVVKLSGTPLVSGMTPGETEFRSMSR